MDLDKLISIIEKQKIDFGINQDKFISYCCYLLFDLENEFVVELEGFIEAFQVINSIYEEELFTEHYELPAGFK